MEIKHLKKLADNPMKVPQATDGRTIPIRPLPMPDILEMEQLYNGGGGFPAALRELLFLAGDDCYVFDYGGGYGQRFNAKTMQEYVRGRLVEHDKSIPRPFIAIDFSNLRTKVTQTLDEGKTYEFASDFSGKRRELRLLEEDTDLVDEWLKYDILVVNRKDINVLRSFRYIHNSGTITKLREFTDINGKWVGGHNGTSIFNNSKQIYGVLDSDAVVITKTYGKNVYKQVETTSITMTDGVLTRRKKGKHTWIEDKSEEEFAQEVAYALAYKNRIVYQERKSIVRYRSRFSDGCEVDLIYEKEMVVNGEIKYNYLSAIIINP